MLQFQTTEYIEDRFISLPEKYGWARPISRLATVEINRKNIRQVEHISFTNIINKVQIYFGLQGIGNRYELVSDS